MNDTQPQITPDHDLLIQIDTKLSRAILDIKDLKDDTANRVTALEEEKATKDDLETLAKRTDKLEKLVYVGLGIVLALQFVLILYVTVYHGVLP